ncbi:MAG: DUF393 domain-containing protein [Bryobacteraceae bacterium]|nr:DUF393 domain-containing protein [Bryobacteraceae bacterium]
MFYDGGCGLCHWLVRLVATHDRKGSFRFAPLGGATFLRTFSDEERARLPQSLVVRTAAGAVYTRSDAVAYVLRRLGGPWAVLGAVLAATPRALRDAGYAWVARIRGHLFPAPQDVCPALPRPLRDRFEA